MIVRGVLSPVCAAGAAVKLDAQTSSGKGASVNEPEWTDAELDEDDRDLTQGVLMLLRAGPERRAQALDEVKAALADVWDAPALLEDERVQTAAGMAAGSCIRSVLDDRLINIDSPGKDLLAGFARLAFDSVDWTRVGREMITELRGS